MENDQNSRFWKRWMHEAEPIFNHGLTVVLVEVVILVVGGGLRLLLMLFPDRKALFEQIENFDIWTMLVLLCMFGFYSVFTVFVRLFRTVLTEWQGDAQKPKTVESKNAI